MTIIAGQNDDYTIIILMIMTFYPHNHQGQPEICVPMTVNSLPGLFFMSGDWFDLSSRQWQRSRCFLLLHIVVAVVMVMVRSTVAMFLSGDWFDVNGRVGFCLGGGVSDGDDGHG